MNDLICDLEDLRLAFKEVCQERDNLLEEVKRLNARLAQLKAAK